MRFLSSLLSASVLIASALAAKKTPEERFNDFHTKSLSSSPIKLSEISYKSLTASPRDYSVAVLLTALEPRIKCQLCREFQPEWDLLSQSWTKGDKKGVSRTLFGTLDFADGREVFASLGLQTAPVLLLFEPNQGPNAVASTEPLRYDFTGATTGPPTAEKIHAWLAKSLPNRPHPEVKRPIDWMRWAVTTTAVLGGGTAMITAWPFVKPILQNRALWASISMISILLFTSGHMFNHIRKVPYVAGNGKNGVTYVAAGFQSQLGLETQIIAALYGFLSFCAISLAVKVPRIANPRTQQIAVMAWGTFMFVVFSLLLSIFRIKNSSYPFSLPPFM